MILNKLILLSFRQEENAEKTCRGERQAFPEGRRGSLSSNLLLLRGGKYFMKRELIY